MRCGRFARWPPLVAMFVTKRDSGIRAIGDLKGRRVVIGPAGAGFEMFVMPILESHGVAAGALSAIYAPQGVAVEMLSDGAADAAFLGGGPACPVDHPGFGVLRGLRGPLRSQGQGDSWYETMLFFKPIPHSLVKSRYPKILHYELEDRIAQMKSSGGPVLHAGPGVEGSGSGNDGVGLAAQGRHRSPDWLAECGLDAVGDP